MSEALEILEKYKTLRQKFYPRTMVSVRRVVTVEPAMQAPPQPQPQPPPSPPPPPDPTQEWVAETIARHGTITIPDKHVIRRRLEEDVAAKHGLTVQKMLSAARKPASVIARKELFYTLNKSHGWGLAEIGRKYGKDHTTILHAVVSYQRMLGAQAVDEAV